MIETGLLALAIIGVISGLKKANTAINGWITVCIAVVLGALAGYGGVEGLNVITGILAGCAAIGTVTVASKIAGKE
jgi:hypothetical protein